jgi:hypothetical protein
VRTPNPPRFFKSRADSCVNSINKEIEILGTTKQTLPLRGLRAFMGGLNRET